MDKRKERERERKEKEEKERKRKGRRNSNFFLHHPTFEFFLFFSFLPFIFFTIPFQLHFMMESVAFNERGRVLDEEIQQLKALSDELRQFKPKNVRFPLQAHLPYLN